jgi:hypothetical protein
MPPTISSVYRTNIARTMPVEFVSEHVCPPRLSHWHASLLERSRLPLSRGLEQVAEPQAQYAPSATSPSGRRSSACACGPDPGSGLRRVRRPDRLIALALFLAITFFSDELGSVFSAITQIVQNELPPG